MQFFSINPIAEAITSGKSISTNRALNRCRITRTRAEISGLSQNKRPGGRRQGQAQKPSALRIEQASCELRLRSMLPYRNRGQGAMRGLLQPLSVEHLLPHRLEKEKNLINIVPPVAGQKDTKSPSRRREGVVHLAECSAVCRLIFNVQRYFVCIVCAFLRLGLGVKSARILRVDSNVKSGGFHRFAAATRLQGP